MTVAQKNFVRLDHCCSVKPFHLGVLAQSSKKFIHEEVFSQNAQRALSKMYSLRGESGLHYLLEERSR